MELFLFLIQEVDCFAFCTFVFLYFAINQHFLLLAPSSHQAGEPSAPLQLSEPFSTFSDCANTHVIRVPQVSLSYVFSCGLVKKS